MAWLNRLSNLMRRRDLNAEIDEELQFHLDARITDNIAAGMTDDEARREAFRRFGSRPAVRERTRDANIVVFLERLWHDLQYGARVLARSPALTTIAIISIAFGTGANVAIFSLADTLLLRPLPVRQPSELLAVGSRVRTGVKYQTYASYPDYLDVRDRARSFSGLVALDYEQVAITHRAGDAPHVRFGTFVTSNYFHVLGVDPIIGRAFLPEEEGETALNPAVILSDGLWRSSFESDPSVLGRKLRVGGVEFSIVGVTPEAFSGLHPYVRDSLFLPLAMLPHVVDLPRPDALKARDARILTVKGRLAPGVSLADAQAELATIGGALALAFPETNENHALIAQTEFEYRVEMRPLNASLLLTLTMLSMGVLCVACANVASLLASRGPVRAREMALRLAIGASRTQLVRQLITESLLIAIAGAAGGLLIGRLGILLLNQIQFPTETFAPPVLELEQRTLWFSLTVAMASALLVGLGPALQSTRVDLTTSLKSSDRGGTTRRRVSGRSLLVALQVALSLVLLTMATFAVQIFSHELNTGPGFRTTNIAKANIIPSQARYTDDESARFFTRVVEEARALPGVRSAAVTSAMPLFSYQFSSIRAEGQAEPRPQDIVPVWSNCVDDRYFSTMEIPVLAGRAFAPADNADAPPVAIVNDTLARHYWLGANPVGKRVQVLEGKRPWVEIVGVVTTTELGFPGELPQEGIYFPYQQQPHGQMVLLAKTAGDSAALLEPLRDLVGRIDRDVPLSDVQTMETFYGSHVRSTGSVLIRLVGGMGLMGMTLTMVGLYGLVSYAVSRRTREIGIRMAIGATAARVVNMFLRQGMTPAWIGLAAGLVLSAVTTGLLARISPLSQGIDARTYYVVVPLLMLVTLFAVFVPARRAARVNPTEALRCE